MSLKVQFSALSFGASVDQQTGSLSIFEVLEELRVPQLPVQLPSAVISLVLEKQMPEAFAGKMLIHFFTPDGTQRVVGNGELAIPAEQRRMKAVFRFGGFPIQAMGNHRFVLSVVDTSNKKVAEALMDFTVVQAAQVAQAMNPSDKPPVSH